MSDQIIKVRLPKPHPGQQKVLDSKARWKTLLCGRRWGKSLICQIIAINKMLQGHHVAYVCPTHELGRTFFQSIQNYLPQEIIESDNKTDRKIQLITGGSIRFYSGENLSSFRGNKYHVVIVDEAAFIPDLARAWGTDILPTLTDYKGEAIWISTPNGKDWFYAQFMKNGQPGYESFHFTSYQNPTLPEGAVDELKAEMTTAEANQEIYAIAGETLNSAFGDTSVINRGVIKELSDKPTVSLGIDVASYNDWTVVIGLDEDGKQSYHDRFQLPWPETIDRLSQLPAHIPKLIDGTGGGAVVFEQLDRILPNLESYVFTTQSKLELITKLVKDIEESKLGFLRSVADEMTVYQYKRMPSGHYSYNARPGFHDDQIAALALANWNKRIVTETSTYKIFGPSSRRRR